MTQHGFLELNGNTALALLPLLVLTKLVLPAENTGRLFLFGHTFVFVFSLAVFLTNSVHRWSHLEAPPRGVRWLQARGWILCPSEHALHHAGEHTNAYCITTGWLNPLLDRLGLFRGLERVLSVLGLPLATG